MLLRLISGSIPKATLLETGAGARNDHESFLKVASLLICLQINAQNFKSETIRPHYNLLAHI